jgi:hypothetical protein
VVTLDAKLTHKYRISKLMCKANYRLNQLYPTLNKCSPINTNVALTIYKSLIRSALKCAASDWGHAAKTFLKKPQIFQNQVLLIINKLPKGYSNSDPTRPNCK